MAPTLLEETIAAIATPLGEGGLAVIRISGPQALEVIDRCFRPLGKHSQIPSQASTHTMHYGGIYHQDRMVDEVMLAVMRAPRTFTREDTVEITCHGGLLTTQGVLQAVLAQGARLAAPGEFTKRAFLNGRIDLAQAEAVADLIQARTELALSAAREQLAGRLSQRINHIRDLLLHVLAHLEAQIDFPEEDIAPDTRNALLQRLEQAVKEIDLLLRTAQEGQILRRGLRAAIVGRPNVGKSSLLNELLGHERAIVSPIPGTTRDTIQETANIRGIPVVFIDTAGIRDSHDPIEREGVRRSHETAQRAELILLVLDRSEPLHTEDERFLAENAHRKCVLVSNKADLAPQLHLPKDLPFPVIEVSCHSGEGIEALKTAIKDQVWTGEIHNEMLPVMINARHQEILQRTRTAILQSIESLRAGRSLELVAIDTRLAANAVGEIVGYTSTEDLLDVIFSQFCLGK